MVRLTRPNVLLATAYLATKAHTHTEEGDYKAALQIIFNLKVAISHDIPPTL